MPDPHWDIRPETGFGTCAGKLEAFGFHGPNTLGATTSTQDLEMSVWGRYRDIREYALIPPEDQTLDIDLRRTEDGTRRVFLRFAPDGVRLMSQVSDSTLVLAANNRVVPRPGAWYNLRMRTVGSNARVWIRLADGSWGFPVLSAATLPLDWDSEAYAFTVYPDARYDLSSFRIRSFSGAIDASVGTIDTLPLTVTVDPQDAACPTPSGGRYPHGDMVYLSSRPEPYMIHKHWEDADNLRINNPSAKDTWIRMAGARDLTVKLRPSYSGPDMSYGDSAYDSTYAPFGETTINLTGLASSYESGSPAQTHPFFAARVTITVEDYPSDDPKAKVTIDGPEDVVDGQGNPIAYSWPVGTKLSIKAEPLSHPAGFEYILLGWATSPGTAINQCPTPEEEHEFTVPPLDAGQTLSISLMSRVIDTGATVTSFPYNENYLSSSYSPSRAKSEPYTGIGVLGDAYDIIGPVGACAQFDAGIHYGSTINYDGSISGPIGQVMWPQFTCISVDNILYFPWTLCPTYTPPVTRDIPIEYLGDKGDLMLTYGGSFLDGPITLPETWNPSISPMITNQVLSPGFGSMKSTEDTPISYLGSQYNGQGLLTKYSVHGVGMTLLTTDVVVVGEDANSDECAGYIQGQSVYGYDPGDLSYTSLSYPFGRPVQTVTLTGKPAPGYAFECWNINGSTIDSSTSVLPDEVTSWSSTAPMTITVAQNESNKVTMEVVPVEFCLTFDDGPFGYATPDRDKNNVTPYTRRILDCLARHAIKATFFVQTHRNDDPHGGGTPDGVALMQRMINEGHSIGVHVGGNLSHDAWHTSLVSGGGVAVDSNGDWGVGSVPSATIAGGPVTNTLVSSMIAGKRRLQSELGYDARFVRPPGLYGNGAVYAVYGAPEVNLYNSSNEGSDKAYFLNCIPTDGDPTHSEVITRLRDSLRGIYALGKYKRIVVLFHDNWSGKDDVTGDRIRLDDYISTIEEETRKDIEWKPFTAEDFGQYN